MANAIVSGVILGFCALIVSGIGISQVKSKTPVGFYTGVKPPEEKELSDVGAWNRKHGTMWILYGVCIVLSWVCGLFLGDSLLVLIPFTLGLLLPLPFMILYHRRLIKRYMIR